jgi:hypothetical protein
MSTRTFATLVEILVIITDLNIAIVVHQDNRNKKRQLTPIAGYALQ